MLEKILISVISSLLTLAIVGVFARLRSVELIKLLGGVSRKEFSELKRNTQKIGLTENGNHTTISLGLFSMHFQDDGNVVIYDHKGNPIWDTGTGIKPWYGSYSETLSNFIYRHLFLIVRLCNSRFIYQDFE